jgi:periplasmic divalent cation tolerance protein
MSYIFIYITNPSKKGAEKISLYLLKKRLIACGVIFPVNSSYWWKKKIVRAKEHVLIVKTLEKNFEKVKKEVKRIHPYEIPCITKIKVEGNKEYENWVREEVK